MKTSIWLVTIVSIASAGLLAGCAASVPPVELIDARQAYRRANTGQAAQLGLAELFQARDALDVAERSFREDPASTRTRELASVAERKAKLAETLATSVVRKAVTTRAESDSQATLATIKTIKLIAEARCRAAAKVEQDSLSLSKKAGLSM
jgi:hypothetical protein